MKSSSQEIPEYSKMPKHIAIIMDGNGRWAKKRFLPRAIGHKRGLDALEKVIEHCAKIGVKYLTVFAFSTENWRRPQEEVSLLMKLFIQALQKKVNKLHKNNLRLKVIGKRDRFNQDILEGIISAENLTSNNDGLTLVIAADYGGRWDITQAVNKLINSGVTEISEENISENLMLRNLPEPDLFIRTGGETRVSNFLLWELAYTECYFTEVLWPDFNSNEINLAIKSYQQRERRFGRTTEQLPIDQQRIDVRQC